MKVKKAIAALAALTFVVAACGGDDDGGGRSGGTTRPRDPNTVTIVAADVIQPSVQRLVDDFEAANAGTQVDLSFAGQNDIPDILDADDAPNVVIYPDAWVQDVPDDVEPESFGRNLAVIVVPPGNPGGVTDLSIFDDPGAKVQACGPNTQFGNLIAIVLANAGIAPADGVIGVDCGKNAADKVAAGELDAAVVFRTEVAGRDDVDTFDVSDDANLVFPISYAVLASGGKTDAFVQFVESADGQRSRTQTGLLP